MLSMMAALAPHECHPKCLPRACLMQAEGIALDLAGGKEVSAKQAQDMAWNQASVSVWDLAQVEEEAHQDGKLAVWEEEAQAQMARQDSAMRKSSIERDFGGQ